MLETQKKPALTGRTKRGPVDGTLAVILLLLLLTGLLVLFSATYYTAQDQGDPLGEVKKQLLGIGLGTVAMLVTSRIPYRFWQDTWVIVGGLGLSVVLLVLVIIPGVGVYLNGSRRWLSLGGISFQPSEIAKMAVVMYMAATLTYRGKGIRFLFRGILPVLVVPGFMFLLILEQPNLSTAGSILIVSLMMILMAGARWKHLSLLGVAGMCLGAFYAWSAPYRRERLLSFTDPFAKMSDEGYQLAQFADCLWVRGTVWHGIGTGTAEVCLPALPGERLHLCHRGGGFRTAGMHCGGGAVRCLYPGGDAHCGELPG